MRFSQRSGITPAIKIAQRESMDDELRASLWSLLSFYYWDAYRSPVTAAYGRGDYVRSSNLESLVVLLWMDYFNQPTDTIETYWPECHQFLRKYFFDSKWYEVYDFIEFVAKYGPKEKKENFIKTTNSYLERENSAYRFLNGVIAEITSEEEILAVENALQKADKYSGVRIHLRTALMLMSDRKNPDCRNSIKESISAVESLAKKIANDEGGTLGVILKELEKTKKIHPALKAAFSSLYGYTNDSDGIRHALLDEANLTKADSRFMLVCCSAFINYCIEGIELE